MNACGGGGSSISVLPSADEYDQYSELNPKMDILWVVDNSNSMQQEIDNVIANIEKFVAVYVEQGYDFRMGVVSSSAWALESYYEYKTYVDCVAANGSNCIQPQDNEDRSYLIHPADNKSVFGRFHMGECIEENSGIPFIQKNTADITNVFSKNFNVYGLDPIGNCGTNTNYNTTYHPVSNRYVPFIHDYYHNVSPNPSSPSSQPGSTPAASPLYGSAARARLFAYVGDERPIQSMRAFLNPVTNPEITSFLRSDAFLAVILITDEEDHSRPALKAVNGTNGSGAIQDYVDFLTDLKGSEDLYKVYSITQLTGRTRLKTLAESTGGFHLEINRSDDSQPDTTDPTKTKGEVRYLEMLTQMTSNIVESSVVFALNCEPLLNPVNPEDSIRIEFFEPPYNSGFNVPKASENNGQGWGYNASAGEHGVITFTEDYYPQSGTKIYINYTPASLGCNP